jgi:HNH endonuclease
MTPVYQAAAAAVDARTAVPLWRVIPWRPRMSALPERQAKSMLVLENAVSRQQRSSGVVPRQGQDHPVYMTRPRQWAATRRGRKAQTYARPTVADAYRCLLHGSPTIRLGVSARALAVPDDGRCAAPMMADEPLEVGQGRPGQEVLPGAWVALATRPDPTAPASAFNPKITHRHKVLYQLLAMYAHGTEVAQLPPTRARLAGLLGYSRPDKIDPIVADLEKLGSIRVVRGRRGPNGSPIPNLYLVHDEPPAGYEGPLSLADTRTAARRPHSPGTPSPHHQRMHFLADRDGSWACYRCGVALDVCSDEDMELDEVGGRVVRAGGQKRLASVDHLVPRQLGGSNHPNNQKLACIPCNSSKGAS